MLAREGRRRKADELKEARRPVISGRAYLRQDRVEVMIELESRYEKVSLENA
jgi:hypothetical protein